MAAQYILKAKKNDRPTLRDIVNFVVPDVHHKWYDLGLQLLDPKDVPLLEGLKLQYPNTSDRCREVFKRWLDVNTKATWGMIMGALNKRSVDLPNVPHKIERMLDKRNIFERGAHKLSKVFKGNQPRSLPPIDESHQNSSNDTDLDVETSQLLNDEDSLSNTDGRNDKGSDNESVDHIFSSLSHPGFTGGLRTALSRRHHASSVSDDRSSFLCVPSLRPYYSVPDRMNRMESNYGTSESLKTSRLSLNLPPTFANDQQAGSTGSLHTSRSAMKPMKIPTTNTTTKSIQKEEDDRGIQDLYQQSKQEVERLKEKNKSQAETIENLQGQIKDFERIKERSCLLEKMLDKAKEENQKLNQEVTHAKVEASGKLAAKVESEKILREAKTKLEEDLQTMQTKCEKLAIQLESTKVELKSKLEKIDSIETQNKELHNRVTQQQTQQREQEKEQQKLIQKKITGLEESLKKLQESFFTLHVKVTTLNSIYSFDGARPSAIDLRGTDCTKEDLIEIIEVHVEQIVDLHQLIHTYKRKIAMLQQKLKCVSLYL